MLILFVEKFKKVGELLWKFTDSAVQFHVNFFQWDWTMPLEYKIKCMLFTRKWHVIEQSLAWQNGIWLLEYNSSQ